MRFIPIVLLVTASFISCNAFGPQQGEEGGPCGPDQQCFSGLNCLSNLCVDLNTTNNNIAGSGQLIISVSHSSMMQFPKMHLKTHDSDYCDLNQACRPNFCSADFDEDGSTSSGGDPVYIAEGDYGASIEIQQPANGSYDLALHEPPDGRGGEFQITIKTANENFEYQILNLKPGELWEVASIQWQDGNAALSENGAITENWSCDEDPTSTEPSESLPAN